VKDLDVGLLAVRAGDVAEVDLGVEVNTPVRNNENK